VTRAEAPKKNPGDDSTSAPSESRLPHQTVTHQVGPTIELTPSLAQDGGTVQMNILASVAEFLGYDDAGPFKLSGDANAPVVSGGPLPRFRIREVATTAEVTAGQTLVLGGFLTKEGYLTQKVPLLGDLPLLGRLFRTKPSDKHLLLFVTPKVVSHAGAAREAAAEAP
jgi:general secretion pathway protein D